MNDGLFSAALYDEFGSHTVVVREIQLPGGGVIRKDDLPSWVPSEEPTDDDLQFPIEPDAYNDPFNIRIFLENHLCEHCQVNKIVLFGKGRTRKVLLKDDLERRGAPPDPATVRSRLLG